MYDYEYLFSTELHKKLKEKIVGGVWVKCYNDELHVKITSFYGKVEFEYTIDDFGNKILNSLSSDTIVYQVCREYKQFILNNYVFK